MHDIHKHVYEATIDGQSYHFDKREVNGEQLLAAAGKRHCAYELVAERKHHDNIVIEPGDRIDLTEPNLKGFITAHKEMVTIWVNEKPFKVALGGYTVEAILELVGENIEGYQLYPENDGPPLPVPDDKKLHIKGCESFISQVRRGKSS